ncbi:MAG: serine hydrolase domain-containing protein, partial [Bacteroidota bacterium]
MKKYLFFIFIIAAFSCQSPHTSQEESQASDSLSPQLEAIYQRGNLPGFSVSLVEADQIVYQEAFGQADVREAKKYTLSTRQPLGSISKTLIGLSLLKAQELGKLQLDDPINKYLPYPIQNPHFPEVDITIRHLANHTSTITDTDQYENSSYFLRNNDHLEAKTPIKLYEYFNPPEAPLPIRAFMKNMLYTDADSCCREVFLQEKPGSTYQYSNGASTLAAVILEIATDMSFRDFTKKYILQPLDMKTSSWDPEDIDATLYYDG